VANEKGAAQTGNVPSLLALRYRGRTGRWTEQQIRHRVRNHPVSRMPLEGATEEGDSPVGENWMARIGTREYYGTREIL
jgi:hypothetical protein